MKYIKYLFIGLVVSISLSSMNIRVYNMLRFQEYIPGFNGKKDSPTLYKQITRKTQEIRHVKVDRELDVILRRLNGPDASKWHILRTGQDIIFNDTSAKENRYYSLTVDSRIYYKKNTDSDFLWFAN